MHGSWSDATGMVTHGRWSDWIEYLEANLDDGGRTHKVLSLLRSIASTQTCRAVRWRSRGYGTPIGVIQILGTQRLERIIASKAHQVGD